jgi:FtsP/CotA-like multicopper oxidase with cupredoxin domain
MRKRYSLIAIIGLVVVLAGALPVQAVQSPQVPFPSGRIPQFADPLPVLSVAGGPIQTVFGNTPQTVRMCEFKSKVLPSTFVPPAGSTYAGYTWVWGYLPDPTGSSSCADLIASYGDANGVLDTYTGPVVLNYRADATHGSTQMTFINDLGDADTTNVLAYKYSTDQTLHWADPLGGEENMCNHMPMYPAPDDPCAQNYAGPVLAAVHLHGGEVPPELDGGPDSWMSSDGAYHGHGYYTRNPGVDPANGEVLTYPNTQEASPIWFHDHVLGSTRLNVYAGLAGAYLIEEADANTRPAGLAAWGLDNGGTFEPTVPLVIQDRMFDTNGQLFFPADSAGGVLWSLNPQHPYWVPEFVGDTILVNGKVWPYLDVQPKRYRFLFLNGSNARTYEMFFINPANPNLAPRMWVIATDGGYLDTPVTLKKLLMQPGERYEVIVDFAGFAGTNLVLKNTAKTPFPAGATPKGSTVGTIMQFRVGAGPVQNLSYNPAAGVPLRPLSPIVRLVDPVAGTLAPGVTAVKTRELTLNEIMGMPMTAIDPVTGVTTNYPGGPLEILVNNTKWSGESDRPYEDFTPVEVGGITTYYSELPQEGQTEIWEIVNTTADAHPIHLHLVQFQLINRQAYDVPKFMAAYNLAFPGGAFAAGFGPPKDYRAANNPLSGGKDGGNPDVTPYLKSAPRPPEAYEAGWKDTIITYPGQVTRLAVRWAPTSLATDLEASELYFPFDPSGGGLNGYVWHCHIIDHEDNEMMRPDLVQLNPFAPLPASRSLVKGVDY